MAPSKKYLSLEEAAAQLKLKTDELIRFREKGEIRGFADRGTWKFKSDDVEEFRRRRQPDSDPDVPIMDDEDLSERFISDPDLQTFSSSENVLDEDDELGRQATVIRKGRDSTSDSDVRLVLDDNLKGRLTGSSGELPVLDLQHSDSDVRLVGDSSPRLRPDSDSDVKLVNPMAGPPDSDSDVKLVNPMAAGSGLRLSDSDSDVRIAPLSSSDSDVKLVGGGTRKQGPLSSDSDVALLPGVISLRDDDPGLDLDAADSGPGASALFDADADSAIVLPGDSGIRLSGDSGIQLRQPADSGILLEGADSGLKLDAGDSGIRLGGDSSLKLASLGGSSKKLKGGSSKNLKGRKPADDLDVTAPMLLAQDDDDLNATSPMLLGQDDELSGTDLEVPMLDDDAMDIPSGRGGKGATSVVMFDDDDFDDATTTKSKKKSDDSAFDLDDEESGELGDDDLEVSDEVLGEDDELEDLDAFDSDEDEFDESFEAGASQIGFGQRANKIATPQEVEWGTGFILTLVASTFVMIAGSLLSVDLLRTTWASASDPPPQATSSPVPNAVGNPPVYQGELLDMISGPFK